MSQDLKIPPLTAGAYLRKRREAAGLTVDEVAAGCAGPPNRDTFAARLVAIEADQDVAAEPTIWIMKGCFHFDPEIYRNLVAGVPAGTAICRNCACSWNDACIGKPHNCYWAEPDLCSRCAAGVQAPPEPTFTIGARDPHAVTMMAILSYLRLGNLNQARRALEDGIREENRRQARAGLIPAEVDQTGGEYAATVALDMTAWRMTFLGERADV